MQNRNKTANKKGGVVVSPSKRIDFCDTFIFGGEMYVKHF